MSQPEEDLSFCFNGVFVKQKLSGKNLRAEERQTGLEPATSTLARWRTTNCTTIAYKIGRATDGTRTRDLHLGKVAYYQLYYYRIWLPDSQASNTILWISPAVNTFLKFF